MTQSLPATFTFRSTPSLLVLATALSLTGCTSTQLGDKGASAEIALQIAAGTISMNVGDSIQVHAGVSTSAARLYTLKYETDNGAVASVSADGVVTALAAGAATIGVLATLLDTGGTATATVQIAVAGAGQSPGTLPSSTWVLCAQENERCNFAGTHDVKYGVGDQTITKTFTDGVQCDNSVFSDPAVGYGKACWYAATASPPPAMGGGVPPLAGVEYTGVSAAMWAEINAQRAAFGDTNDCKARVDAIPTIGATIHPGADINAALASSSVVILSGGTYNLTSPVNVPAGKKLIGAAGQIVTLNASGADRGVQLGAGATLANVIVDGAATFGVLPFDSTSGYSSNTLIYQVSVRHTGFYSATSDGSIGIFISGGAANNCVVSSEASNSWNELGGVNAHGGNSDGIDLNFGAHDNTLIDVVSFQNGDDGIDMWHGGQMYAYFCNAHDNGKVDGKGPLQGDGNGIKLGVGDVSHKFYKTTAVNNRACGYDLNGNTKDPQLVKSTATGNPGGDYCYFTP